MTAELSMADQPIEQGMVAKRGLISSLFKLRSGHAGLEFWVWAVQRLFSSILWNGEIH
jgi:hypothetical protein